MLDFKSGNGIKAFFQKTRVSEVFETLQMTKRHLKKHKLEFINSKQFSFLF